MNPKSLAATIYALAIGLIGIGALVALTDWSAVTTHILPLAFFTVLSFLLKRAGYHASANFTLSLVGVVDLAAVLVFGPLLGAWVAGVSGFFYLFLTAWRRHRRTRSALVENPLFNAGLKIGMAYASSHVYLMLGGKFAPHEFTVMTLPAVLVAALAWFVVDYIGWGVLDFLRQGKAQAFIDSVFSDFGYALLIELLPLPFSIVIAVVYVAQSLETFLFVALGLVGTAVVVQRFADTSRHLEQRQNEMAVMNELGGALSLSVFDSEKVIGLLHEYASRIIDADLCRIDLVGNPETDKMMSALEATPEKIERSYEMRPASPVFKYLAEHRDSIRVVDALRSYVYPLDGTGVALTSVQQVTIGNSQPRSALFAPMFAGDELIGMMSLYAIHPKHFRLDHARNLIAMCNQAAVTIQNARLYAAERKRSTQMATISEVSRQVAALLDLDEVLQTIVERIREQFGYSYVQIFTLDSESGYLIFRASTHPNAAAWRERPWKLRIGLEGIVGWVAATREPLFVDDVTQDRRYILDPDQVLATIRSELAVPLLAGDQVLGVLDVQSTELAAFKEEDLFVLRALGAQIAVAIQNARLFNAQKEEAYFLNVMLQVAENLSETSDLNEALDTVVRITPLLVGVARCAVFQYDPPNKQFVPAKAYGLSQDLEQMFFQLRFPTDNGLVFERLVKDPKPIVIEDAATSDLFELEYLTRFDIRSLLIVPLMTRGEIVGAMLVDQGTRPRRFSQHEIEVVMGIANQAAVAIESARLGLDAQEKKRMEYELGLARQIQTSFLPDACPQVPGYEICSQWQTAREVSGDFYDFIPLRDGRLGIVIADVSDKGMAAAMFMALARTIVRTMAIGKPTAHETLERANDVILADARSEMFVTVFYAMLDPRTHRLDYVIAGHNPPLIYRAAQNQVTTLQGRGIALGVLPDVSFQEHEIQLEPGDMILMYTDGATDAINANEEEFGLERLVNILASKANASPDAMVGEIIRGLADFAGEGAHFDDVTLVGIKRV